MKKIILILLILILLTLPFAAAETCQVSKIKQNLRKALYEYFNSPQAARLALGNIKDLLNFYLAIQPGQTQVNCDGVGLISGEIFARIIQDANNITVTIPTCSDGTEFGECSTSLPKYCYNGDLVNKCSTCGCATGSCLSDGSCSVGQPTLFCGDGSCNNAETCSSCSADCGSCQVQNQTNQTSCTNECTSGQLSCSGSYARTCGNYDADSCLEWNTGTYCANGCTNGVCSIQSNQTGFNFVEKKVTHPSELGVTHIGDRAIVWQDNRNYASTGYDIYAYDYIIQQEVRLTSKSDTGGLVHPDDVYYMHQDSPDISGNKVVYVDHGYECDPGGIGSPCGKIYLYDFDTNQHTMLKPDLTFQRNPKIYGNKIVWSQIPIIGIEEIWLKDLETGTLKFIDNGYQSNIYGDYIVYQPLNSTTGSGNVKEVRIYNILTHEIISIPTKTAGTFPNIYQNKIIYRSEVFHVGGLHPDYGNTYTDLRISLYDLQTGQKKDLFSKKRGVGETPAIYGNYLTFEDEVNNEWQIFLYDLTTEIKTQVTNAPSYRKSPQFHINKISWQDYRSGVYETYMTTIN